MGRDESRDRRPGPVTGAGESAAPSQARPKGAPADGGDVVEVLLRALVDDAGLFPPTALPMAEAVHRHRADRNEGEAMLTHRFLCPVSRWEELRSTLADDGDVFQVGLVIDTESGPGGAAAAFDPRVRVTHYEMRAAPGDEGKAARYLSEGGADPAHPPVYLEMERAPGWPETVAALAGAAPLRAKVRCGGASAELFPAPSELAAFIAACVRHAVPFKATAGLHHAVRHTDGATGFTHHGYLNLLLATARAVQDRGHRSVVGALTVEEPDSLARELRAVPLPVAERTRELFVAYGACSTRDPVADAKRLGLAGPG